MRSSDRHRHKSGPFRPKLRYAHQGGINPPLIVIHGNSLERVTDSYKRYLEGCFRDKFSSPACRWHRVPHRAQSLREQGQDPLTSPGDVAARRSANLEIATM